MNSRFKYKYCFTDRLNEAKRVLQNNKDKIPIICQKNQNSDIIDIQHKKFLVSNTITLGQFICIIRKKIKLNMNQSLFCFINNILPTSDTLISDLYNIYKNKDGFLYIYYSGENSFG